MINEYDYDVEERQPLFEKIKSSLTCMTTFFCVDLLGDISAD